MNSHEKELQQHLENEEFVNPNKYSNNMHIRKRRIRKIKIQKNTDIYGQVKTCKNRSFIRSIPRHF